MSKNHPYKNNNKFLITERSLNYILRPVQVRKENYPYTYCIENMNETVSVTVDRAWTPYNHLILDFIGHELHIKAYKDIKEKRTSWKNEASKYLLMQAHKLERHAEKEKIIQKELKPLIPKYENYILLNDLCNEWNELYCQDQLSEDKIELLKKRLEDLKSLKQELVGYLDDLDDVHDLIFNKAIRQSEIEFKLTTVFDRYNKFFKNRRKEYIKKLLKKTSEVRFTFEYPLRVPVIEYIIQDDEKQPEIKEVDLKKIKIENDKCFNVEFDGNDVRVIFNTFLGNAYLHNIITLNTDWFEKNFLELEGFASAIYRRFFVTRPGNKFDQLAIKDLVNHFGFLQNSSYPQVIKKAFEEIKNAGLIYDYRFVVNGGKFSKGYIEVIKSTK